MDLANDLVKEFASLTAAREDKPAETTCYATAVIQGGNTFIKLDGADMLTPAIFTVNVHNGDRVLVMLKGRKALVIGNITTPMIITGILQATDGVIVNGWLTTNPDRTVYNDQIHRGLTFSQGGLGAFGGDGKYWYVTNLGDLYASSAEIVGKITAKEGYIGTVEGGFKIDNSGILSVAKGGLAEGNFRISNADFSRSILGSNRTNLRLAIGNGFGVTSAGKVYASDVELTGKITASSGYLGSAAAGFTIDETGIFSGQKTGTSNGYITLSTADFTRKINNVDRVLRFAIGSKFGVSADGTVYAAGATISGVLTAGAGSKIGPWSITDTSIYKGSTNAFNTANVLYFGNDGLSLSTKFRVNSAGELTATGADIVGKITATSGKIGGDNGWDIGTGYIRATYTYGANAETRYCGIGVNGTAYAFFASSTTPNGSDGVFRVTHGGALYATGAEISGTLTAGAGSKVGPWIVTATSIYKGTSNNYATAGVLYFGDDGLSITDKFKVSAAGILEIKGANLYIGTTSEDMQQTGVTPALRFNVDGVSYGQIWASDSRAGKVLDIGFSTAIGNINLYATDVSVSENISVGGDADFLGNVNIRTGDIFVGVGNTINSIGVTDISGIGSSITAAISALGSQMSNIKKVHQEFFGADYAGMTRTVELESGRMYLVFVGKANNASATSGCYLACPHSANGHVVALAAAPASTATVSISTTTLIVSLAANYVMLSIMMVY